MTKLSWLVAVVGCVAATVGVAGQQSGASRKALESAADKGRAPAQYALGAAAEAENDFERAVFRYRQAAAQGYAPAELKLGEFFEHGKGTQANTADAIEWYRKAAAHGQSEAVSRLTQLQSRAVPTQVEHEVEAHTPTNVLDPQPVNDKKPAAPLPGESDLAARPTDTLQRSPASDLTTATTRHENGRSPVSVDAQPGRLYWAISIAEGALLWALVRTVWLGWYRSGSWLFVGRNQTDVLKAQIGNRLGIEKWSAYLGFGFAFLSNFVLLMWWRGVFK